jgi:hypothetical protein
MTGLDFAHERGWVDTAEYERAEQRHRGHATLCAELRAELVRLRSAEPEAYAEAMHDAELAAGITRLDLTS